MVGRNRRFIFSYIACIWRLNRFFVWISSSNWFRKKCTKFSVVYFGYAHIHARPPAHAPRTSTRNEFSVISYNDVYTLFAIDFWRWWFFFCTLPEMFFYLYFQDQNIARKSVPVDLIWSIFNVFPSPFHPFCNNSKRKQSIIFQRHHTYCHIHTGTNTDTRTLMGLLMHCQNICILQFVESIRVNGWMIVRGTWARQRMCDSKRISAQKYTRTAHTTYRHTHQTIIYRRVFINVKQIGKTIPRRWFAVTIHFANRDKERESENFSEYAQPGRPTYRIFKQKLRQNTLCE